MNILATMASAILGLWIFLAVVSAGFLLAAFLNFVVGLFRRR